MKKVKQAFRFNDIQTAKDFIDENKLPYDEVIVLFDNYIEDDEKEQKEQEEATKELPKQDIDQDRIIKQLIAENEKLRNNGVLPTPPKASLNPFKKKPKVIEIKEVRES